MIIIKKIAVPVIAIAAMTSANANLSVFTDHQVIYMAQHAVNKYENVRFPTGNMPYIGRLGLQYDFKKISYSLAYIHRSNVDLHGDEYSYDGVSIGIKYKHCLTC